MKNGFKGGGKKERKSHFAQNGGIYFTLQYNSNNVRRVCWWSQDSFTLTDFCFRVIWGLCWHFSALFIDVAPDLIPLRRLDMLIRVICGLKWTLGMLIAKYVLYTPDYASCRCRTDLDVCGFAPKPGVLPDPKDRHNLALGIFFGPNYVIFNILWIHSVLKSIYNFSG